MREAGGCRYLLTGEDCLDLPTARPARDLARGDWEGVVEDAPKIPILSARGLAGCTLALENGGNALEGQCSPRRRLQNLERQFPRFARAQDSGEVIRRVKSFREIDGGPFQFCRGTAGEEFSARTENPCSRFYNSFTVRKMGRKGFEPLKA